MPIRCLPRDSLSTATCDVSPSQRSHLATRSTVGRRLVAWLVVSTRVLGTSRFFDTSLSQIGERSSPLSPPSSKIFFFFCGDGGGLRDNLPYRLVRQQPTSRSHYAPSGLYTIVAFLFVFFFLLFRCLCPLHRFPLSSCRKPMSMNLRPPSRRVPLNYCARRESQSGSSCVPIVLPIFFTNLFDRVYFSSLSLSAQCVLIPYFFLSCCEASSQRQYFVWF